MDDRSLYTAADAVPATTPTEYLLIGLWQRALGVGSIGREDNFLEFGGTSMLATRVAAKVEAELGVRPSVDVFLESDTLSQAAAAVDALTGHGRA